MRKVDRNHACPCGSRLKFRHCCAPYLAGDLWPDTPERLMRSRYTAFVTGDVEHLYRTTHPKNEAVLGVSKATFCAETLAHCEQVNFRKLTVHQAYPEDEKGVARVLFTAEYETGDHRSSFAELSEFMKLDGKWVYYRGDAKG